MIDNHEKIRSSRLELFYKKVFLEISENSQENACARVSFLIKLQPSYFPVFGLNTEIYGVNLSEYKKIRDLQLYLKRDSGTGVFLWILRNFQEHFFYRTPLDGCFWKIIYSKWQEKKIREYKESQLNIYDYESFPEEFRTGNGDIYLRVIAERNTFR